MTPKEQAIELFDKFMGWEMNPYNDPEMTLQKEIAKRNCLIAIDLIIAEFDYNSERDNKQGHWQQVRIEVNSI